MCGGEFVVVVVSRICVNVVASRRGSVTLASSLSPLVVAGRIIDVNVVVVAFRVASGDVLVVGNNDDDDGERLSASHGAVASVVVDVVMTVTTRVVVGSAAWGAWASNSGRVVSQRAAMSRVLGMNTGSRKGDIVPKCTHSRPNPGHERYRKWVKGGPFEQPATHRWARAKWVLHWRRGNSGWEAG